MKQHFEQFFEKQRRLEGIYFDISEAERLAVDTADVGHTAK